MGPPGPAGPPGPPGNDGAQGSSAYSQTTATFNVPALGVSVNISVNDASWMTPGQEVFAGSAGYYIVQPATGGTVAVLQQDPNSTTNVAVGTLIAAGVQISPAGFQGIPGSSYSSGSPLAIGSGGTGQTTNTTAFDALSPLSAIGQFIVWNGAHNVALPAASSDGQILSSLAAASGGVQWSTPTALGLGSGDGGVPDLWDPQLFGYAKQDDDFTVTAAYTGAAVGGAFTIASVYGQDTVNKVNGSAEFSTGTAGSAGQGYGFNYGPAANGGGLLVFNLGPLNHKTSIFLEGTLPATGISYCFRAGFGSYGPSSSWFGTSGPNNFMGAAFQYVPDNNSGQWQIVVGNSYSTTPTIFNTPVAVAPNTRYDLEIDVSAGWSNAKFLINGVIVLNLMGGFSVGTGSGSPFFSFITRGSASTTNFIALADFWAVNYSFTR